MPTALSILHVISAPAAGGAEIYVKELSIELKRKEQFPVIAFIGHASDHGRDIAFESRYLHDLEKHGIPYFFIGDWSRKNPLLGAWSIWNYCRSNGIDIYHSHLGVGILFGLLLKIPRFYTHHNSVTTIPRWFFKLLNRMVDRYIGISIVCADRLRSFTGRTIEIIRNGLEISRLSARTRQITSGQVIRCISVGRIFPQKNYDLLVSAIALLPPQILTKFQVSIVGEGPRHDVDRLGQSIVERGLTQNVHMLGNRVDVPDLLDSSSLYLMSSAWEGFPISLLEATASGLPFVATDVGGCREIAELCGNGIIVPPQDPQALADALVGLAKDRARYSTLSKAAVRNAHKLSIEAAARDHLKLYHEVRCERDPKHHCRRPQPISGYRFLMKNRRLTSKIDGVNL